MTVSSKNEKLKDEIIEEQSRTIEGRIHPPIAIEKAAGQVNGVIRKTGYSITRKTSHRQKMKS